MGGRTLAAVLLFRSQLQLFEQGLDDEDRLLTQVQGFRVVFELAGNGAKLQIIFGELDPVFDGLAS